MSELEKIMNSINYHEIILETQPHNEISKEQLAKWQNELKIYLEQYENYSGNQIDGKKGVI